MRRLFYILMVFPIVLLSCKGTASDEVETWQKTIDIDGGEVIIENQSGELLVGTFDYVYNFDPGGDLNWRSTITGQIPNSTRFSVTDIIEKTDDGYALMGYRAEDSSEESMLLTMDLDGNIVSKNSLAVSDLKDKSYRQTESGYQVMGVTTNDETKKVVLLELNKSGELVNKQSYTVSDGSNRLVEQVLILPDGSGYLFQTKLAKTTGEESSAATVVKLDEDFKQSWSTSFGEPIYFSINSLLQTADGGYLLAGAIHGIYGWCVKLSSEGRIEWQKEYDSGGAGKRFFFDVKNDANGGYILAGDTNAKGSGANDCWIVKS